MADQFTTVNEAIRNHLKARYPLIGLSSTDGLRLPLGKVGGRRIWLRLGLRGGERAFLRAIVTGPGRAHLQARSAVDAGGQPLHGGAARGDPAAGGDPRPGRERGAGRHRRASLTGPRTTARAPSPRGRTLVPHERPAATDTTRPGIRNGYVAHRRPKRADRGETCAARARSLRQ